MGSSETTKGRPAFGPGTSALAPSSRVEGGDAGAPAAAPGAAWQPRAAPVSGGGGAEDRGGRRGAARRHEATF